MVKVTWYLEPDFPSRLQSSHSVSAPDFPCKKVSVYTSDLEHKQKDWLSVYEFIPVKEKRLTWIDVGEQLKSYWKYSFLLRVQKADR